MTEKVTRLAALRALLAAPSDHADQSRIGHRVIFAKPDARVWLHLVWSFTKRRTA